MFDATLLISVVATAMVYVLSTYGLMVTYRVAGVFNLAFGYQAALAAFLYWQLNVTWGIRQVPVGGDRRAAWPGPLMGILIQRLLFRRRRDVLSAIILTLGLGVFINGLIEILWSSAAVRTVPSLFGQGFWRVGSTSILHNDVGVILVGARDRDAGLAAASTAAGSACRCGPRSTTPSWPAPAGSLRRASARRPGSSARCWQASPACCWPRSSASTSSCSPAWSSTPSRWSPSPAWSTCASSVVGALILAYAPGPGRQVPQCRSPFWRHQRQLGGAVRDARARPARPSGGPAAPSASSAAACSGACAPAPPGSVSVAIVLIVVLTLVAELLNPVWAFTGEQVGVPTRSPRSRSCCSSARRVRSRCARSRSWA